MFWTRNKDNQGAISELASRMRTLEIEMAKITEQILSLRNKQNRLLNDSNNSDPIEQIRQAFGGELPIELQQLDKYKNRI